MICRAAQPHHARGQDKFALAQRADLGLDDSGNLHPARDSDDDGDHHRAGPQRCGQRQHKENRGEGQEAVHRAHQRRSDPAAAIASGHADERSDQR